MNRKAGKRRGFTLLELAIVSVLALLVGAVTALTLRFSARIWSQTTGRDAAERELATAERMLRNDLIQASTQSGNLAISNSPASLGGGADGSAIDYLSAVNPTTRDLATLQDGSGTPYYFTNLFYYITVPRNHQDLYGLTCTGGNQGGYDYNCPHKILVRGVEDQNPAYNPLDTTTQDTLLPSFSALLTRPNGFPHSPTRATAAARLLTFQVVQAGAELQIVLKAVSLQDAQSQTAMGTTSYKDGPYTLEHRFSVYPRN